MKQATIKGPIQVTIEGPQGAGKTQFAQLIRDMLESLGVNDRVTITERQTDPAPVLLDALAAARAVLSSILGADAESAIIREQVALIDTALAKARAA